MNNIKAIIHDWDDTITNAFETYGQFHVDFGKHYKFGEVSLDEIKKYWGRTVPQIVEKLWPDLTYEEFEKHAEDFKSSLRKWRKNYTAVSFPGSKETIKGLHDKGYLLGIVSSGNRSDIEEIYKREINQDLKYHEFIFDPKDLGIAKPNPTVFDRPMEILKKKGINETEVIYVGDSFHDYEAATNRGIGFIAVTTGVISKEDFIEAGLEEKYILETFNDLLKLF